MEGQCRVQPFAVSSLKISRKERDLGGVTGVSIRENNMSNSQPTN